MAKIDTLNINGTSYDIAVKDLIDIIYPVGSIYMSVNNVSPATFLGGTWEALQNRFLVGAGDTYAVNATGGEATHTLTVNEMPSHRHDINKYVGMVNNTGAFVINDSNFDGLVASDCMSSTVNSVALTQAQRDLINANTGGGAAHNNLPPYLAVYMWKRTA